jgi:hypothetical protein
VATFRPSQATVGDVKIQIRTSRGPPKQLAMVLHRMRSNHQNAEAAVRHGKTQAARKEADEQ